MAEKIYGKIETMELETMMCRFTDEYSVDITTAFNGLLDYIIGYLDPNGEPIEGWAFSKEQNKRFHDMMYEYFLTMDRQLRRVEWYDAWGDLFMALFVNGRKGQFFTPPSLVNMMADGILEGLGEPVTEVSGFGRRHTISDPACGSSRNLLSAHVKYLSKYGAKPYLSAEDIDIQCCKMSAVNMAVHGCYGEVVCHDTLSEPNVVRYGYIINETMYPFPTNIPSIRRCSDPSAFICTRRYIRRAEQRKHTQLELF